MAYTAGTYDFNLTDEKACMCYATSALEYTMFLDQENLRNFDRYIAAPTSLNINTIGNCFTTRALTANGTLAKIGCEADKLEGISYQAEARASDMSLYGGMAFIKAYNCCCEENTDKSLDRRISDAIASIYKIYINTLIKVIKEACVAPVTRIIEGKGSQTTSFFQDGGIIYDASTAATNPNGLTFETLLNIQADMATRDPMAYNGILFILPSQAVQQLRDSIIKSGMIAAPTPQVILEGLGSLHHYSAGGITIFVPSDHDAFFGASRTIKLDSTGTKTATGVAGLAIAVDGLTFAYQEAPSVFRRNSESIVNWLYNYTNRSEVPTKLLAPLIVAIDKMMPPYVFGMGVRAETMMGMHRTRYGSVAQIVIKTT